MLFRVCTQANGKDFEGDGVIRGDYTVVAGGQRYECFNIALLSNTFSQVPAVRVKSRQEI